MVVNLLLLPVGRHTCHISSAIFVHYFPLFSFQTWLSDLKWRETAGEGCAPRRETFQPASRDRHVPHLWKRSRDTTGPQRPLASNSEMKENRKEALMTVPRTWLPLWKKLELHFWELLTKYGHVKTFISWITQYATGLILQNDNVI